MGVRATPQAGDKPVDTLADAPSAKRETYRRTANEFKTPVRIDGRSLRDIRRSRTESRMSVPGSWRSWIYSGWGR